MKARELAVAAEVKLNQVEWVNSWVKILVDGSENHSGNFVRQALRRLDAI
ncbi:MAG: hypothetical protein OXI60_02085 [Acidiferrobacterales bacterium]|nr:hypothetical protein [Acidiferrobacterales bacterium]